MLKKAETDAHRRSRGRRPRHPQCAGTLPWSRRRCHRHRRRMPSLTPGAFSCNLNRGLLQITTR